jgi:predicted RNA binding protein YcfA (HicA-like mRNA interferase family)
MPPIRAISRNDLIKNLKRLDFTGPYAGKRHQFMQKDTLKVYVPNPHEGDISKPLLLKILKQANISKEDWEVL